MRRRKRRPRRRYARNAAARDGAATGEVGLPRNVILGEFEQLVLLAVLQAGNRAHALGVRRRMGEVAGRRIARGALYRTLERLESKGYVRWRVEAGGPERGGHARRLFTVTARGIAVLRASRRTLLEMWTGLEDVLS